MNVTIRDANDAKVVDFEGSLDTSTSPDAEGRLSSLMEGEGVKILINFEKLDYISSAGLRVLLVSAKRLKSRGGELRLCHLNETVQEVFEISGFSSILKVFNTESEALEGF
jgi:anti-sigma B factor antagonist